MKLFRSKSEIGLALVIAALVATTITLWPRGPKPAFYFHVTMRSALPGFAQLYYDAGPVGKGAESVRLPVEGGHRDVDYQFPLTEGRFTHLRFYLTDQGGNTITLSNASIVDRWGNVLRSIRPGQLKSRQAESLEAKATGVTLTTTDSDGGSNVTVELEEPLVLKNFSRESIAKIMRRFARWFLVAATLGLLVAPPLLRTTRPAARRWLGKVLTWARTHPQQAVLATAAAFVIWSCYPIVFFGKSFLSPSNHPNAFLLYGEMPTLPSYRDTTTDEAQGSDLGAPLWQNWPYSVVQSRGLSKYGELPLWNRYNSCGLPLLGQGLSMCAEPLQLLVLLAGGSSGAWDLKYLLAKWLFASCLGLCVLQAARHLPAALIIASSAPFIGFFSFRYAHPAFFSLCYAPSILLCWFKLIDARPGRATAAWLTALLLADWTVMNSGTVKEGYILLLALNVCGFLTLLLGKAVVGGKANKVFQVLFANALFLAIAMPVWLTFFHALHNSLTVYDAGGASQLSPSLFIGLFDDIFYRQFDPDQGHLDPSLNFFILLAVLWFLLSPRRADPTGLTRGLAITSLSALAFAFAIVPSQWIVQVPLLKSIVHIDNTFSCVAIVCLLVLAGFGIKTFWTDCRTADFERTYLRVIIGVAGLLALYLGTAKADMRSPIPMLRLGEHIPRSSFFWGYSLSLVVVIAVTPWFARRVISAGCTRVSQVFLLALFFLLLHWRHGMHLTTPFNAYVMNPQRRVNLIAESSPALTLVKTRTTEPSRSAGLDCAFFPGYGGAVGVEQIDGPDPLLNKHYRALMKAAGVKLLFGDWRFGITDEHLGTDLPLFNMLNVRYFLGYMGMRSEPVPTLRKIASLDLNVYESDHVWPRAFFTDGLVAYEQEEEFIDLLKKSDGTPFAGISKTDLDDQVELAKLAATSNPGNRKATPATDYVFTNNTTSFKINAPGPGVVVLTEAYVPGDFQVSLNGKPTNYFRVNSAFKGLFVQDAGSYAISYAYWPRYLTLSLWIAGAGVVMFLGWVSFLLKAENYD